MAALLAERQPGWWDLLDLARGGLDARLHRLVRPPPVWSGRRCRAGRS